MSHQSCGYRVTRLVFDAGQPHKKFRGRYEATVPPADPRPGDCPGRHVRWQDAAVDADGLGPRGFIPYWLLDALGVDAGPLLGQRRRRTSSSSSPSASISASTP
jgi:hypothetical protein